MKNEVHVYSEIGQLKTVLLHKPYHEIENLVPEYLERLLFDDIAYIKQARIEHDVFADLLRKNGAEVLYLSDLVSEVLENEEIKNKFLDEFIDEGNVSSVQLKKTLIEYLKNFETKDMVEKIISGIRTKDIPEIKNKSLVDMVNEREDYPFYLDPLPNLYFQRDPFATIGSGITLNRMSTITRNRETIFAKYIFDYHSRFKGVHKWYDRNEKYALEGGDELVLSNKVLAIGISQRTTAKAIQSVAKRILGKESFETILAFNIPKARAYMHLDTVFTMVDHDSFTIHPGIEGPLELYSIRMDKDNSLSIKFEKEELSTILSKYLDLPSVNLIRCGGGDFIDAGREQWSDGSNTLAISPGKVLCYDRNYVTNEALRKNGIEVIEMPSYELSRGRGGPRCMSMPLVREDLN
ncbi:arginine deiminase [Clostridium sp. D2Q-11]|uniref:Arginine deiminase n=1 Tax=Anaeromonas frigoriresistens TaxID=2683708 RepID=A0A942V599_9FIRM|nr:arginine deiminase [Anaeromonas frigoriresistens]MBS4540122.1 arginine deiminase [Anaeromonas frigoriresistens]